LIGGSALGGEPTPYELREKGFVLLKAAQDDPDKIVEAAKVLAAAVDAYAAAGDETAAQALGSCLYWAKKKMTLQQINGFIAKEGAPARKVIEKLEIVERKEVKPEDAAAWLAKANQYAEGDVDSFLVAVGYFEVASRFPNTPEAKTAMEKSLAALQKARVAEEAASGKVYVQSEPPGASILLQVQGELRDLKCKTPSIVKLPQGMAVLILRKEKFMDTSITVTVGDVLAKPNPVVLEVPRAMVDIVSATPGWYVSLDGKLLKDKTGQLAVTPCTLSLPIGSVSLRMGKEGFSDIVERVSVAEGTTEVIVKSKEVPGKSLLLSIPCKELLAGRRYTRATGSTTHPWLFLTVLHPDGNGGFQGDGIKLILQK
jgi:hypothetical protein